MSTYEIIRSAHGIVGVLALASFWTAGLARKGSPLHKLAGKVFLLALAAILASALPMAGVILARGIAVAPFLFYLVLITATSCWTSWRAIRDRRDYRAYTGRAYQALALLNLAGGAGILALGVAQGQVLYAGFSLIGLAAGADMLRSARRPPADPRWWLREHYRGMIGNGVATHIAFLAIGLPRLLPQLAGPTQQMLAWFGPVALGLALRVWLERKYRAPAPSAAVGAASQAPAR